MIHFTLEILSSFKSIAAGPNSRAHFFLSLPQIQLVQVEPAETGFIASCHHFTAVYLEENREWLLSKKTVDFQEELSELSTNPGVVSFTQPCALLSIVNLSIYLSISL